VPGGVHYRYPFLVFYLNKEDLLGKYARGLDSAWPPVFDLNPNSKSDLKDFSREITGE